MDTLPPHPNDDDLWVHAACSSCGQRVPVLAASGLRLGLDRAALIVRPLPDSWVRCAGCSVDLASEDAREDVERTFWRWYEIRARFGLPPDATMHVLEALIANETLREVVVLLRARRFGGPLTMPNLPIDMGEGQPPEILLAPFHRVEATDASGFAVERCWLEHGVWQPDPQVDGVRPGTTKHQQKRLYAVLDYFAHMPGPGRPKGSTGTTLTPEEVAAAEAAARRAILDRGDMPTNPNLLQFLPYSKATRYRCKDKLSTPSTKAGQESGDTTVPPETN